MAPNITFDESAIDHILSEFGKKIDDQGYVVEDSSEEERVLTPEGEEIRAAELAGIAKGSQIFVEDNFVSLINFAKKSE